VLIRAEVENSDKRLLPGMFANVSVLAGAPQDVVTVPRTAVTYSLYGDSVYVVKAADGDARVAERRFVRLGTTRDGRIAINEGLTVGEAVITSGQIKLQPNARVTVDNSGALQSAAERPKE
jgi:membrane fusion protein (multidrug efflux system)